MDKVVVIGKRLEFFEKIKPLTVQLFAADEISDAWNVIERVEPDATIYHHHLDNQETLQFVNHYSKKGFTSPLIVFAENHFPEIEKLTEFGVTCLTNHNDLLNLPALLKGSFSKQNKIEIINEYGIDELGRYMLFSDIPALEIVGRSKSTEKTLKMISMVAKSRCNPVLIIGETGTGKELAAKAIHLLRHGENKKFVAVNCAALTANLLESELFGHTKGSFTGAEKEKTGLFELAEDGTIFLDEISEMPVELQAKLLRVLQEKTFRKVGGTADITCNATIITSSNRNLLDEVEDKKFRRDLYYRLSVCPIKLSPLKSPDRMEDIPLLAEYFIKTSDICPDKRGKIKGLTKLATEALMKHNWPGNVRELKNVIERAIMLESTDKIGLSNLMFNPDSLCDDEFSEQNLSFLKDFSLEKAEKELISRALRETNWQKTRAASLLGITRATLYAKVKQYNLCPPEEFAEAEAING